MKQLNERQQRRWDAAKRLFESLKTEAKRDQNNRVMFDDSIIEADQIVITETAIEVKFQNCRYVMFEADPDFDHGLYDKTADYERYMRKRFTLVKKLEW